MTPLHRFARRAARRIALAQFVRALGATLPVATVLALVAVGVDRFFGSGFTWWWAGAIAVGVSILASAAWAWRTRVSNVEAAATVDEAMRLRDALGSALALESKVADDPFASMTVDEARSIATRVSVHHAIPVKSDTSWWWWVAASTAFIGVGIFLPQFRSARDRAAEEAAIAQIAERDKAQAVIEDAVAKINEPLPGLDPESGDFDLSDHQATLDQIRDELAKGKLDPEEAAAKAAEVMDNLAKDLENKANDQNADDAAARDLANRAADEMAQKPDGSPIDKLIDAMRSGDPEAITKASEEVEKAMENMSDAELENAANRLEQFAKAMDNQAKAAEQNAQSQANQSQKSMSQRGMSKDAASQLNQDAAQGSSLPDLEKRLRDQGMSEQAARDMAKQLSKSGQQQRSSSNAAQRTSQTAQNLRKAAENCRACKNGGSNPNGSNPGQGNSNQQGNKNGSKGQPGKGQNPSDGSGECEGDGEGSGGKNGGTGKSGGAPVPVGTQELGAPGAPKSGAGRGTALHNLKQQMNGAAQRTKLAKQMQFTAQDLRMSKNDMLRQLGDKTQLQKQQWIAQELAEGSRDKGWRPDNETVDARESSDDGEVVSQQIRSGDTPGEYDPSAISNRQIASTLTTEMEAAERAIENKIIPPRYQRTMQRYFQKTIERAESESAPPAPAPDAKDAGAAKPAESGSGSK